MNIYLILHNIRSLHNVGSIFRTADGAGVKKIYLTGYTPSPYDFFGPPSAISVGGGLRKDFAKTALGAEKFVEWGKIKNIGALIEKLQTPPNLPLLRGEKNYFPSLRSLPAGEAGRDMGRLKPIFIASLEQSPRAIAYNKFTSIYRNKLKKYSGVALIVGNEVRGLSPAILKKSDAIIEIPMRGQVVRRTHHPKRFRIGKESLNVSVATGIVLYELQKQTIL